jgi:hypothetical protein
MSSETIALSESLALSTAEWVGQIEISLPFEEDGKKLRVVYSRALQVRTHDGFAAREQDACVPLRWRLDFRATF